MNRKDLVNKDNLKGLKIKNEDSWVFYKEALSHRSRNFRITNYSEYTNVINSFLRLIRHYWIHSTGGVHIKGMGFFSNYLPSEMNNIYHGGFVSDMVLSEMKGKKYIPMHTTDFSRKDYIHGFRFYLTRTHLRKSISKNVSKGKRYTLHYYLLKDYLKNKKQL